MEQTTQPSTYLDVTYTPGHTVYGSLPARLEWTEDNRLKLTTVEGTKEAPIYKELFNLSIGEILKVKSSLDYLSIVTPQKTYRMSVAQYATAIAATGGVVGPAVAAGMYKKTGTAAWLQKFREHGVAVSRFGYGALYGIGFGAALLFIAIVALVFWLRSIYS